MLLLLLLFDLSSISCLRKRKLLSRLGFLPTAGFNTGAGRFGCGLSSSFGDCGGGGEVVEDDDFLEIGLEEEGRSMMSSSSDRMRVAV